MGDMEVKLLMTFATQLGKKVSLSVSDPREDLTEAEIKTAMDLILSKNIFAPNGDDLKTVVEAKVVQTATTEYDLIVA
ncbi:MAG: DUF2922 domain-containing protein [Romboutsia sp.]|uniref:DUF2922 domain-containing protein n=1 Tax=Romboutsia sp. TaxID=1965302 RepID=UPI003F31F552